MLRMGALPSSLKGISLVNATRNPFVDTATHPNALGVAKAPCPISVGSGSRICGRWEPNLWVEESKCRSEFDGPTDAAGNTDID